MIRQSQWVVALALSSLLSCWGLAFGQEKDAENPAPVKPPAKKPATDSKNTKNAEKLAGPIAIPQDAEPAELIEFIIQLVKKEIQFDSRAEKEAYMKQVAVAITKATGVILGTPDVEEEIAKSALEFRFQTLDLQRQLEVPGINKAELQLAEKYSRDKRKSLAAVAKEVLPFSRLRNARDLKPEDQELLLDETIAALSPDDRPARQPDRLAMDIGGLLEESGNTELAAKSYEKFAKMFARTGIEELVALAEKFKGTARRMRLPGRPIEISGTLLDGKKLDWTSYKGRVVLIDFWATWCAPCVEEFPNIKAQYRAYHAKGFDVLGISLDDDPERVEAFIKRSKIPWSNLFSHQENATGMEHPLAVKYGVMLIPCTILVGKDGKVIGTNLHGPKLAEALKAQLGEPATVKETVPAISKPEEPTKKANPEKGSQVEKSGKPGADR